MQRSTDQTSLGGQGVVIIYRLNDDHTEIKKEDGTTAAALLADATLNMGLIKSTNVAFQENGGLTVTMPHLSKSQVFLDFRNLACPPGTSSTGIEVVLEDGQKITNNGGTPKPEFLALIYPSNLTGDGQECIIFPCTVTNTSGSFTTSQTDLTELSFELIAIPAKADISFPEELHDSVITGITAPISIPVGSYFNQSFIAAP